MVIGIVLARLVSGLVVRILVLRRQYVEPGRRGCRHREARGIEIFLLFCSKEGFSSGCIARCGNESAKIPCSNWKLLNNHQSGRGLASFADVTGK